MMSIEKVPCGQRARLKIAVAGAAVLAMTGCTNSEKKCTPSTVYAQNRFQPPSAATRTEPSRAKPLTPLQFKPNDPIVVDSWRHTGVIYPEKTKFDKDGNSFENDIWFHVARGGYVSFQGVRRTTTEQAPDNMTDDIGKLAVLKPECEIKH